MQIRQSNLGNHIKPSVVDNSTLASIVNGLKTYRGLVPAAQFLKRVSELKRDVESPLKFTFKGYHIELGLNNFIKPKLVKLSRLSSFNLQFTPTHVESIDLDENHSALIYFYFPSDDEQHKLLPITGKALSLDTRQQFLEDMESLYSSGFTLSYLNNGPGILSYLPDYNYIVINSWDSLREVKTDESVDDLRRIITSIFNRL